MEIEFSFKSEKEITMLKYENCIYDIQLICFPTILRIEPNSSIYLDLIFKLILQDKPKSKIAVIKDLKNSNISIRKVLIGKLKGSTVIFPFFIEIVFNNRV